MRFKWIGPENWYVGDAGGEGKRMSRIANGYECSEFGGHIKTWLKMEYIEVI